MDTDSKCRCAREIIINHLQEETKLEEECQKAQENFITSKDDLKKMKKKCRELTLKIEFIKVYNKYFNK